MFFRNAQLYRFTQPLTLDRDALAAALASKPHREPASQEITTYGFVAPFGGELVEASGEYLLIAAKKTERNLPGTVVREALKKKVDVIEADQMRKVYKKERDQLKDEIVQALLPQAFLRHKITFALIAPGMIIIDAASPRQAEDLLSTLREAIGSLPVRPASVKIAPSASLTQWVKDQEAGTDFYVLDECELRDTDEGGGTVRCKREDLTADAIELHLASGKLVTKLALAWQDKLSFLLDDKLSIRRLRFEDILHEKAEQDGGDDKHGQLIASLSILGGTLAQFIPALLDALGGEEIPQGV